MKKILIISMITLLGLQLQAQKYLTKTGNIRFFSDAPLEKIEAVNKQINAAFDAATGDLVFKVLMKSFNFEKALMQEHFNENYVESDKYPNSTFTGKVTNLSTIDFQKPGKYPAEVDGKLTLHGVTQQVKAKGTFDVSQGKIVAHSKFTIQLPDYKIDIPGAVIKNISKTIEITVDVTLNQATK